ncbi:MAG: PIG-L family deacetylase [Candidatus Sumerlaeota bacterium]|nr:PIG-L family deacetylase [Candidatus Sumerlaeota bacterium]
MFNSHGLLSGTRNLLALALAVMVIGPLDRGGSPAVAANVAAPGSTDDGKVRIVAFGAHPDDAEIRAGGVGALWAEAGHHVEFVSVTNGDIGHFAMSGGALAQRRTAEVKKASEILGSTSLVLDIHDGELEPTLENRRLMTRVIRRWNADVVIGHRPNDYHPDHRYVGVLMQDCAFMVGVPFFCPDVPALAKNPVFLYSYDGFQRPNPFRADIVVAIDKVIEKKVDALAALESQFVEGGALAKPNPALDDPTQREKKRNEVRESFRRRSAAIANQYRDKLIETYGPELGKQVRYAEAFEVCEYGRQPKPEELRKLFPFLPEKKERSAEGGAPK